MDPAARSEQRDEDPRIPAIGTVTQAERMFRTNWISNEWLENEAPHLSADFVSRQGRHVRLIDIRETAAALVGELGYLPGSDWVPQQDLARAVAALDRNDPIVIISRGGARSGAAVRELLDLGFRFVAAMHGGIWAWRDLGYSVSHDIEIASRKGIVRDVTFRWEASKSAASLEDVEAHLGDPMSIRWLKLAALLVHGRASCVDGRDGSGVIGTPGGDAGEFLLLLSIYERITGRTLTRAAVDTLLARRIHEFGRFYIHSDVGASNTLIKALRSDKRLDAALAKVFHAMEWRAFMLSPPEDVRPALLDHMTKAEHLGCGHLRLSMQRAAEYGTRPELVADVLRGVFAQRWNGAIDIEYSVLPGGHAEGGVLSVFMEEGVHAFSRIPLVSPSSGDRQFFIAHPQVATFLREQQIEFLLGQSDLAPLSPGEAAQLGPEMHAGGGMQTGLTLGALAKGLPIYQARFKKNGSVTVLAQGHV